MKVGFIEAQQEQEDVADTPSNSIEMAYTTRQTLFSPAGWPRVRRSKQQRNSNQVVEGRVYIVEAQQEQEDVADTPSNSIEMANTTRQTLFSPAVLNRQQRKIRRRRRRITANQEASQLNKDLRSQALANCVL